MSKGFFPLLLVIVVSFSACFVPSDPEVPRPASGARNLPGEGLVIHLGEGCPSVASVTVGFESEDDGQLGEWALTSLQPDGAPLETLTVGITPEGFEGAGEVRDSWLTQGTATIEVVSAGGTTKSDHHVLTSLVEETPDHPGDEWRIQDVGWVESDDIVSEDDFRLSMCPDDEDRSG